MMPLTPPQREKSCGLYETGTFHVAVGGFLNLTEKVCPGRIAAQNWIEWGPGAGGVVHENILG